MSMSAIKSYVFLFASLVVLIFLGGSALADQEGDFTYTVADGEVTITGYTGPGGAVTVPDTIAGKPVTAIAPKAFGSSDYIDSVDLPDSITSIGNDAFSGCFNLQSVKLPKNLTSINDGLFCFCVNLNSIIIPSGVTSIGTFAFHECRLNSVVIPDSVTSIGLAAFKASYVTDISLPSGITVIEPEVFSGCGSLKSITIPDGVASIGNSAFFGSGLESVSIPSSVISIGANAFAKCYSLQSISIPSNVKTLGNSCFSSSGLVNITVPATVINLGYDLFSGCHSMESATLSDGLMVIMRGMFYDCIKIKNVAIPPSVKNIISYAFTGCSSLEEISLPDGVRTIGYNTFANCTALQHINLPDSVNFIDRYAFCYTNLENIIIPKNVSGISEGVFSECRLLARVTIPDKVSTIGASAFTNCTALTSIILPGNLKSIKENAFYGCSSLSWAYFMGDAPAMVDSGQTFGACVPGFKVYYPNDRTGYTNPWYGYQTEPSSPPGMAFIGFDSQGGSAISSLLVNMNTTVSDPVDPARTGYIFSGWYKETGCETPWFFDSDTVTQDMILYAKWTAINYTITFDSRGGSGISDAHADYGTTVAEPTAPERTGYNFSGWYTESNCIDGNQWDFGNDTITESITLYANWKPNTYTVSFSVQDGYIVPDSITVTFGAAYGTLPSPGTRSGFAFGGWYTSVNGLGTRITDSTLVVIAKDHALYAKWTPNTYIVTFEPQGGIVTPSIRSVTFSSAYGTLPKPDRTGYAFGGWYLNSGYIGPAVTADTTVATASDHRLFAKWTANTYTVTFESQGGVLSPTMISVIFGAKYGTLPIPTRNHYDFFGWYPNNAFTGATVNSNTDVSTAHDHTLYSKWIPDSYFVIFDSRGGSAVPGITACYNSLIAAPCEPICPGYIFTGWFKDLSFSAPWNFTSDVVTSDTTLYAGWASAIPATPKAESVSYNSIIVTWTAIPGANEYEVWRKTSIAGAYSLRTTTTAIAFIDKDLATGSTYFYIVRSISGTAKTPSGYSSVVSARPVPSTPSCKAACASYNSIKLTWSSVLGASNYEVWRCSSPNGTYKRIMTTSARSYINGSLATGTTYYYKVKAYRNVSGKKVYGGWSTVASAKTTLGTPSSIKAARASSTSVRLSWSSVPGRTKYEIWRCDTAGGTFKLVGTTIGTSYTNARLTKGQTYYYKVRAYHLEGAKKVYGGYAKVVSAKT